MRPERRGWHFARAFGAASTWLRAPVQHVIRPSRGRSAFIADKRTPGVEWVAAFTKDRDAWLTLPCIDVADGTEYELSMAHDTRRSRVIPQTYGYVLHFYPYREESKSLAPDGSPCVARTRGVLQRASVLAGQQHFVGKETDRRWEFGDDLSVLRSKSMEYRPRMTVADAKLREQVAAANLRALMRATNLSQHTLEAIRAGSRVRSATLARLRSIL
jgi:hypothetical protein